MKVAVLGAGISGLLAAKALNELGIDFVVFDRTGVPVGYSFQGLHYLHNDCGLGVERRTIYNHIIGGEDSPEEAYARRFGRNADDPGSIRDLPAFNKGYDIREALGNVWGQDCGERDWGRRP